MDLKKKKTDVLTAQKWGCSCYVMGYALEDVKGLSKARRSQCQAWCCTRTSTDGDCVDTGNRQNKWNASF